MNNSKKVEKVLQRPDKARGEKILSIADDVHPFVEQNYEQTVPEILVPDLSKGEKILCVPDLIPFNAKFRKLRRRKRQSAWNISDPVYSREIIGTEPEPEPETEYSIPESLELDEEEGQTVEQYDETLPEILVPDLSKGQKILCVPDLIPFKAKLQNCTEETTIRS